MDLCKIWKILLIIYYTKISLNDCTGFKKKKYNYNMGSYGLWFTLIHHRNEILYWGVGGGDVMHANIHWQFFRKSNKTREMSLSSLHLTDEKCEKTQLEAISIRDLTPLP